MKKWVKSILFLFLLFLFPCSPAYAEEFCLQESDLTDYTESFTSLETTYAYVVQGMCIAKEHIIATRWKSNDKETMFAFINLETGDTDDVCYFKAGHANSLTYAPDKKELVVTTSVRGDNELLFFSLKGTKMTYKGKKDLPDRLNRVCYLDGYYYGATKNAVFRSDGEDDFEEIFDIETEGASQGMGTDGKYLYICNTGDNANYIYVYDTDGEWIRTYREGFSSIREIEDVAFRKGRMYIADNKLVQDKIMVVDSRHEMTDWQIEKKPNCTETGLKTRYCENCGKDQEEAIPTNDAHKKQKKRKTLKPDCTHGGYEERLCKRCKKVLEKYPLHPLGHSYNSWVVIKEPDVLQEGQEVRSCKRCGWQESQSISKKAPYCILNSDTICLRPFEKTQILPILQDGDSVKAYHIRNPFKAKLEDDGTLTGLFPGSTQIYIELASGYEKKVELKVRLPL